MDSYTKSALVVDDEPITRVIVSSFLRKNHYTVSEAENGAQAVSQFFSNKPSLIILDMNMPIMNGCQAAYVIRNVCKDTECKIIIFTAESEEYLSEVVNCHAVNDIVYKKNIHDLRKLIMNHADGLM